MSTEVIILLCIGGVMLYAAMTGVSHRFFNNVTDQGYGDAWFLAFMWPVTLTLVAAFYLTYWLVAIPFVTMAKLTSGKR